LGCLHILRLKNYYDKRGIITHNAPPELFKFCKRFEHINPAFKYKPPLTGYLAMVHAAHIIRPKHLWFCGMDLYDVDYLRRRPNTSTSVKGMQELIKRWGMKEALWDLIKTHSETQFHMISYMQDIPMNIANLEIL